MWLTVSVWFLAGPPGARHQDPISEGRELTGSNHTNCMDYSVVMSSSMCLSEARLKGGFLRVVNDFSLQPSRR